jgi:hypothetical protein
VTVTPPMRRGFPRRPRSQRSTIAVVSGSSSRAWRCRTRAGGHSVVNPPGGPARPDRHTEAAALELPAFCHPSISDAFLIGSGSTTRSFAPPSRGAATRCSRRWAMPARPRSSMAER